MSEPVRVAEVDGFRTLVLLTKSWDESILKRIDDEGLEGLSVQVSGSDLGFLRRVPRLRTLVLNAGDALDLGVVAGLSNLEALTLNTPHRPRMELDFRAFPRLRRLGVYWNPGFETVFSLDQLEELFMFSPPDHDLSRFGQLASLRRLELSEGSKLVTTSGIERLVDLRFFGLYHQRSLRALRGLPPLQRLEQLSVESCRNLEEISEIAHLKALRTLKLANCGDLASLAPLEGLSRLERFFAWETTRVLDGDLSVLTRLPRLREVAMRSRRGYTPTVEEVERELTTYP